MFTESLGLFIYCVCVSHKSHCLHFQSSSGGFEQCLKLEVVENFFGSVFPDTPTEPVKPIISEAWSTSYPSNQRQFVTPAATGYPDRNLAGRNMGYFRTFSAVYL